MRESLVVGNLRIVKHALLALLDRSGVDPFDIDVI